MYTLLTENIFKLDIPFENITTSSFLVKTPYGEVIVDCGTTDYDLNEILIPALKGAKANPVALFLTHNHGDHAGGTTALLTAFPNLAVLTFDGKTAATRKNGKLLINNDKFSDDITFLSLPGHSADSGALYYSPTRSLITGDCLQLFGIDKYGCGICSPKEYLKSLSRVKALAPSNIFAAHEYYPLGSTAFGKENALNYINECERIFKTIWDFTALSHQQGCSDPKEIATRFMDAHRPNHPKLPCMPASVFGAIIGLLQK